MINNSEFKNFNHKYKIQISYIPRLNSVKLSAILLYFKNICTLFYHLSGFDGKGFGEKTEKYF